MGENGADPGVEDGLRDPLSFRSRVTVLSLVGFLCEAGQATEKEIATLYEARKWATVKRMLRELDAYGLVHSTVLQRGVRVWRPTMLAPWWMERELPPWPWPNHDPAEAVD